MNKYISVRKSFVAAALVMALTLVAGRSEAGITSNGLNTGNGLSISNGLNTGNGLSISNGLNTANGLSIANGLSLANGLISGEPSKAGNAWLMVGIDPRAPLSSSVAAQK